MNAHVKPRARGIVGVRADASDPNKVFADLRQAVEAMQEANDKRLTDLEKGMSDVVQDEKVDRINASVTEFEKALNDLNAKISAMQIGGGGDAIGPEAAEHAKAFNTFFRKGPDAGLRELEAKASLNTSSDPDGGYVVPEETESTIDRVLGTVSNVRSVARTMTISAPTYKKLVNMGGANSGWVGEKDSREETSTPNLREIAIEAQEIYANPAATQTLLDDSRIDIAAWIADEVSIEFAEQEGAAFVSGDGNKKPRGFLDYDKVANASHAWGKTGFVTSGKASGFADTAPADALIALYYALKSGYRNNATWMLSDAVVETVRKFKDGQGNYLWAAPAAAGGVPTILNKPVVTDDNMPALGANNFPVAFGDFNRAYLIIDRAGIRVLRDPYTNKPYVMFYTTKRVGGGMTNFEALKLLKIAT